MAAGVRADRIHYVTGELLDDHHALVGCLQSLVASPGAAPHFVVVDEVTYVRDWDQGVKFLADAGQLDSTVLLLTGSDLGSFAMRGRAFRAAAVRLTQSTFTCIR